VNDIIYPVTMALAERPELLNRLEVKYKAGDYDGVARLIQLKS
jgi:hypothetical protein